MKLLTPTHWKDYELIDSGGFEKLERFGKYILRRPEPQAIWDKRLSEAEWERLAHARFVREKVQQHNNQGEKGGWTLKPGMPTQWNVRYKYKEMQLQMRLSITSFGHIGIFPEQAENWDFIYDTVQQLPAGSKVLNIFAYTGGASLAAKAAGADVIHVDAVRPVVSWAKENMELSNLKDIRWVVEDALKFVKREAKRGSQYAGIIMDPPAYGRGPGGEKWVLQEQLNDLLQAASQILQPKNSFLVLNLYSMGLSAVVADTLVDSHFKAKNREYGEFYLASTSKQKLPLGMFLRFKQ